MKKQVIAALLSALFFFGSAFADYKSSYEAYLAAIESGDLAAAITHGEAAWRAAENELGDHQTTAILAYNYANLAAPYQPSKAAEAYGRALAITMAGKGKLSVADIEVRRAEALLRASADAPAKEQKELLRALEKLLDSSPDLAEQSPEAHARGWRTVAMMKIRAGQLPLAKRAADLAVESASILDPVDNRLLAESLIFGAVSRLSSDNRDDTDVVEAVVLLDRSFGLFPAQRDIDSFDRLLAQAISWRLSVRPIAQAKDSLRFTTGTRLFNKDVMMKALERTQMKSAPEDFFRWAPPAHPGCFSNLQWKKRVPPRFPTTALNRGFVGAVVVGYDVNATGVERTVLLADFPETGFGKATIESMMKWTLAVPPPPTCGKNHIAYMTFEILF